MSRTLKRNQRLTKPLRLPLSLFATPITIMRRKTVNDLVVSPILRRLIRITRTRADSGCAQQRQAKRLVVRLVRSVLTIRKNRDAEGSARIRKVEPLMRRHLKLPLVVVAAFDRADVPVVSRFRI